MRLSFLGESRRIDTTKMRGLGWTPTRDAETAVRDALRWYVENPGWWQPIKSGEFREFYEKQYRARFEEAGKGV